MRPSYGKWPLLGYTAGKREIKTKTQDFPIQALWFSQHPPPSPPPGVPTLKSIGLEGTCWSGPLGVFPASSHGA